MDSKSSFAKASIDKSDSTQAESANKNDGQVSSKEQIAEAVREIHKTAKASGGVDPKIFENDDMKYVFYGTEEELCSLIKEVVLEDEETRAYAEKTDVLLNNWAQALEKKEG